MAVPRQWIHNYSYQPAKPGVAQSNVANDEASDDGPPPTAMSALKQMLATKPSKKQGTSSLLAQSIGKRRKK